VAFNQPTTAEAPTEGLDPAGIRAEFGIQEGAGLVALLAIGSTREPDEACPRRFSLERMAFSERSGDAWRGRNRERRP
jgi:hypothetical protein